MMPTDLFDRDDNLVPLNTEDVRKVRDFLVSLCGDDGCGGDDDGVTLNGVPFTADQWADVQALRERHQRYGVE